MSVFRIAPVILLLLLFSACDSTDTGGEREVGTAQVRFVHAAAEYGEIDIYVNGTEAVGGLAFTRGEPVPTPTVSDYVDISTNAQNIIEARTPSGTTLSEQQTGVDFLEDGQRYTIIFAEIPGLGRLGAIAFPDAFDSLGDGQYGLRIIQASGHAQLTYDLVTTYVGDPSEEIIPLRAYVDRMGFADDTGLSLQEGFGGFDAREVPDSTQSVRVTDAQTTNVIAALPFGGSAATSVSAGTYMTVLIADVPTGRQRVETGLLVITEERP
jgi:hypothetical protein